jgi:hypothetical protein
VTAFRVAVVGAGIAGLSAARHLTRAHTDTVVFDKARRPGGRVSTRCAEAYAFDHGAQYFTYRDREFGDVVSDWCGRGVAARWDVPIATLEAGMCGEAREDSPRYVGVPGMSALARDLAADQPVQCGQRIERVEKSFGSWRLACEDGRVLSGFDAVVIATPAPQAALLVSAEPKLARRVADVEMQPCHAAMVAFSRRLDVAFGGAFVTKSPLSWVARNGSKPGRADGECWVLHTTPAWSTAHLDDSPDAITAALLEAFAVAIGCDLPPTIFRASHRWRFARADRPLGDPFLWDPEARLGVCGDWTFGGRVESAFLSGNQLARAILGERPVPAGAA